MQNFILECILSGTKIISDNSLKEILEKLYELLIREFSKPETGEICTNKKLIIDFDFINSIVSIYIGMGTNYSNFLIKNFDIVSEVHLE